MKFKKIGLLLALAIGGQIAVAQSVTPQKLETILIRAAEKAQAASVRIWGYDTLRKQQMSAQFSGVVIKDGYILTAAHVTAPGFTYKVNFPDGRTCIAKALGKIILNEDKTRPDVALMKILTPGSWPAAEIGNSAGLKVFEPCLSVSYPESLAQSSPTVRFGYIAEPLIQRGFIRSTCLMEPGDSGGPLFDQQGRVIGLHSAIETSESSNYEVPVDLYFKYWDALQKPETYYALPSTSAYTPATAGDALIVPELKDAATYGNLDKKLANNVVSINSIVNGKQEIIAGTIVIDKRSKYKGLILSKNSVVGTTIIITQNGRKMAGTVIARDRATDMVLLAVNEKLQGGVKLNTESAGLIKGKLLMSPLPDTAVAVGVLSFNIFDMPKKASAGFMGATPQYQSKPAKIYFVRPGSQAAVAGVMRGDIITGINNMPITDAPAFTTAMEQFWPGDTVVLKLTRNGEQLNKTLALSYPPLMRSNHPVEFFAGGKSVHRDGFKHVFLQDGIVRADRMGGPVYDLSGKFYGINIARFSRANTVVMPAADILKFMDTSLSNR